jgi:hypothetical protein
MRAGAAFNTGAGKTHQHRALRPVVGAPVRAGDLDHAVYCFGDHPTRLVAVDAQIALTAVVGLTFKGV